MADAAVPDAGAEDDAARVFLSYSRKDRERAQKIADVLRERHFGVYRDTDDILPTEEWKDRLESLIAEADTIVFLLSPNSVHSEVCAWEVEYATSLNKRVAPIVIDETDAKDIPPLLARLNFIFCTDRDPFENAIDTLVSALNTDIDWIREHTRLAGLAQRWDAAGRPGRLLLRGEDIADAERWRDGHPPEAPPVTESQAALIAESRRAATRRQRLTLLVSLAALVIGLGLAGLAFWQREQALEQEARAVAQERRAVEERNQALTAQSLYLADIATENLLNGDGSLAILAALEAMRDEASTDPQQRDRPHVNAARAALADALVQRREVRIFPGHTDAIDNAVFSPDGRRVVTLGWDNLGRLWNVADGALIAKLEGHGNTVRDADFTPDGKLLATAGDDGGVHLWDGETGALVRRLESDLGGVSTVAFSPDGTRVLSGKGEVWDPTTGNRLFALRHEDAEFWSTYFSPDGEEIMAVETFALLQADARTGQTIDAFKTTNNFEMFDYSPDGEHFLVSVSYGAARISLRDRKSGEERHEIGSPDDAGITTAVFSPDGRFIATGSQDGRARVWAVPGSQLVATMLGHRERVNSIAFAPDSKHVVTASVDGTARVWNAETGALVSVLIGHEKDVKGARFSPDGRHVLTWSYDSTARLWDWRREAETIALQASPNGSAIYQAEFIGDGKTVFTAGAYYIGFGIWDAATGELLDRVRDVARGAVSPDGQWALTQTGVGDTRLRRFDELSTAEGIGGQLPASNLALPLFSPDSKRVVVAARKNALLAEVDGFRRIALLTGHADSIEDIRFSEDGGLISTAARDKTARLWDGQSGEPVRVFEGHGDTVRKAILTPDRKRLVTVSFDRTVRVWDTATGKEISRMEGSGGMTAAAVSPDGRTAVSNAFGGALHLWDLENARELARYHPQDGDWNLAEDLGYSSDGRFIVSGWEDGTTRLHDSLTLEPVAVYRGHRDKVWRVRFRPDDARLVTASWDGSARIYPVWSSSDDLISHAKAVVPRCLTPLERERLHLRPDIPGWCLAMKKWPYDRPDWRERLGVE